MNILFCQVARITVRYLADLLSVLVVTSVQKLYGEPNK